MRRERILVSGAISYLPVCELSSRSRAQDEVAVVFVGYIDESYDGSVVPKVFSLSCLVSHVSMWIFFEWAWLKVLQDKNQRTAKPRPERIVALSRKRYQQLSRRIRRVEFG